MALNEERATLVSAMSKDERLLQTSFVRLDIEDPASADAQSCLEQYFAELNERFENGLNRAAVLPGIPAKLNAHSGRNPNGIPG
jgi:hypothetical protein